LDRNIGALDTNFIVAGSPEPARLGRVALRMQRDRRGRAKAKPLDDAESTTLCGPMIVTDARGRPFYLSLAALALDPDWISDPSVEPLDDDLDAEVVRWRI
jgi:hypothetical protein